MTIWLARYANEIDADRERDEAVAAIKKIGTNAVPILIKWLNVSDSPLKSKLIGFLDDHSHYIKWDITSDIEYHARALSAFELLGPNAKSAVPDLLKALGSRDADTQSIAEEALKRIDPQAAREAGVK